MKYLVVAFLIFSSVLSAQIPVGSWRLHLPCSNAVHLAYSPSKVYCTTGESLFSYNLQDNSVEKLSKISGLSDFGVSAIAYSLEKDVLVIGYMNGNIDIVIGKRIINIPDLKNKSLAASKSINHIQFDGKWAYLSCGFGILLLDIERNEVKDTYIFGPQGTYLQVNSAVIQGNDIYTATSAGIYKADKNDALLVDYSHWQQVTSVPNKDKAFIQVTSDNNILYAVYSDPNPGKDSVFYFSDNVWRPFPINDNTDIYNVSFSASQIYVSTSINIKTFNKSFQLEGTTWQYPENGNAQPRETYKDGDGNFWIADFGNGLIKQSSNSSYLKIMPNGPASSNIKSFHYVDNILYTAAGGTDESLNNLYRTAEFSLFANEEWKSYQNPGYFDYMAIKNNPTDENLIYVSSWGSGVFTYKNGEVVNHFDEKNSTLQNAIPGGPYTRVSGMDFDSDGNLWVANSNVTNSISVLKKSGEWAGFPLKNSVGADYLGDVVVDNDDNIWAVLLKGEGILLVNTNNTIDNRDDDQYIKFKPKYRRDGSIINNIYTLVKDLDGNIWVGTDHGIVVYSDPAEVLKGNTSGVQPVLNRPGSNIVDPLLDGEIVKSIAVDGANRKWIGTERGGAFLVTADGDSSLVQFNVDNSPILSNTVNAIGIHGKTGEVFFGTDQGIIAYRSDANLAGDDFGDVYAFPNPVRPGYHGDITITGLIRDANVKITDIAGNLVYEATTLGGQIVWDGKNFSGRRVASGIYLIFCTNDDGTKTKITKLLFLK
jgi:streptogramin lyase